MTAFVRASPPRVPASRAPASVAAAADPEPAKLARQIIRRPAPAAHARHHRAAHLATRVVLQHLQQRRSFLPGGTSRPGVLAEHILKRAGAHSGEHPFEFFIVGHRLRRIPAEERCGGKPWEPRPRAGERGTPGEPAPAAPAPPAPRGSRPRPGSPSRASRAAGSSRSSGVPSGLVLLPLVVVVVVRAEAERTARRVAAAHHRGERVRSAVLQEFLHRGRHVKVGAELHAWWKRAGREELFREGKWRHVLEVILVDTCARRSIGRGTGIVRSGSSGGASRRRGLGKDRS